MQEDLLGIEENVQELENSIDHYQQYFLDRLPELTGFCIKVILTIIAFWIGRKLIHWVLRFMRKSLQKAGVDEGVTQFVGSLAKFMLYALLIFSIATNFGVTESSVAALLASAGVTIGLALQGGLTNVAGGVTILLFKPFLVGDYIITNNQLGCEGTVIKIELCYTTLLSIDNKHVVIPNGTLSNSIITNVTARDLRKLEVKIGISYESDIKKAKQLLEQILHEDPDTKADTEMVVFVDELGVSSVIMGFRVWVPTDSYWTTKWRLNEIIKETFDREGIIIPYQQLEVRIRE